MLNYPPNTDPYSVPSPPHLPPIVCGRHQAPSGYYYKLVAGKCMLWKKAPHTPVILPQAVAGTGFIFQTPTPLGSVQSVTTNATNWLKNNKGLALVLVVGGYYLFTKK